MLMSRGGAVSCIPVPVSLLRYVTTGDAENAGLENAGLENVGPNRRGGKGRTGKRGNIMCMGSEI